MCKSRTETSSNLGPVFLIAHILYKNRTLSKLGNGHCYNVDVSFYHMCWHHHSQDTHLFHHHKGLLPVAPIGTLTILPLWPLGTIPKLLATTYQSLFLVFLRMLYNVFISYMACKCQPLRLVQHFTRVIQVLSYISS